MKNKTIVIALGGNALGNTPDEQREAVKISANTILDLYENNNKVIVCHGNGPQVGLISNAFDFSEKNNNTNFHMPLAEEGAMSQGYIGFHIVNAIFNEAKKRGLNVNASSIVTQTLVDAKDSSFKNPTKPIGQFYKTKAEAEKIAKVNGWTIKEDAGRGYRRVVASPKPISILEKESINTLVDAGEIVICGGGGGVPVFEKNGTFHGVDAVIDKDFTSAKIAELVKADNFIILTAVDKVFINYGKPNEQSIDNITVSELEKLVDQNMFAEGSMKPKILATLDFVKNTKKPAYISDLKLSKELLKGEAGTKIEFDNNGNE